MHRCYAVTPHAGVWIETVSESVQFVCVFVTPHAGALIETLKSV